jgi:hypothetical protein
MNTVPSLHTIYTIGYRSSPDAMRKVEELVIDGAMLLDIRMTPFSRFHYREWNRKQLQQRFGMRKYDHLELLGNVHYQHPELPMQLYDAEQGLLWLLAYLRCWDVVLLCGCPDPATCHRSLVCRLLHKRFPDIPIIHLIPCLTAPTLWTEQRLDDPHA